MTTTNPILVALFAEGNLGPPPVGPVPAPVPVPPVDGPGMGNAHFHPFPEGIYRAAQQCASKGMVFDEEAPKRGCASLQQVGEDGYKGTFADGTTFAKDSGYHALKTYIACYNAGGVLDDSDMVTCMKTGYLGEGTDRQFGYFDDQVVEVPIGGIGDESLTEKVDGLSTAAKVGIGAVVVGGLLFLILR